MRAQPADESPLWNTSDSCVRPGGLKDTVQPYNEFEGTGTGFSFTNYNAHEMLATVRNAERVYYDNKREWNKMVDRAMAADFSWSHSAKQYEEMYNC